MLDAGQIYGKYIQKWKNVIKCIWNGEKLMEKQTKKKF